MVSSEVTSLQEEEGTMDRLTSDVLSIVLGGREGGREGNGERGEERGRERGGESLMIHIHTVQAMCTPVPMCRVHPHTW